MSEDYDTFSYEDEEDAFYEPVLDSSLPPVPPRRPTAPSLAVPEEPDSNYEDLNDVKELPPIPKLPRHSPSFREIPKRSISPLPEVPQRAPPPRPDTGTRAPLALPDVGARAPLALPDVGADPELNYEDLNDDAQENYEELNDLNERRSLPPPPMLPQRIRPSVPDTPSKKNVWSAPQIEFVNTNMLNKMRENLRKTEPRSQKESPKSQSPEVVVKPPLRDKPQLPPKPFLSKMGSSIAEKINSLSLDSNDGKSNQKTPENKSSNNNFAVNEKNSVSQTAKVLPLRTEITQMNNNQKTPEKKSSNNNFAFNEKKSEENSEEEEFESLGEYMDAAEIMSLHCQPYYFEAFSKSQEHKIFNEDTEDGTFVIRKSRGQNSTHPYTILVYYDSRAFRLKIRFEDNMYAIGEWKADEIKFPSVMELVEHYEQTPLMLIGAGSTTLKQTRKSF